MLLSEGVGYLEITAKAQHMKSINEILAELGAKSITEITLGLSVGYKPVGPPIYEAILDGKRLAITEDEAMALRRQGARTDIPALKGICETPRFVNMRGPAGEDEGEYECENCGRSKAQHP